MARKSAKKKIKDTLVKLKKRHRESMVQLRGGTTDPRTDLSHPGNILVGLGWGYYPDLHDHLGLEWSDPEEKGTGKFSLMPLSMALAIAYRRLRERFPTALQRVMGDASGV